MRINQTLHPKGFSLLETLITMFLFFIILVAVYSMINHYGNVTKNEQARMRLQQESRFMVSTFADELKDAGAVLTLAHTGAFLGAAPFFNGIYPLNSSNFPDGIIIATGDPEAVTVLTQSYAGGGTTLQVDSLNVAAYDPDHPWFNPQWGPGDKGILQSTTGYYVFSVSAVDLSANTLTIRDSAVYYSGLLSMTNYTDVPQGNDGASITYEVNTPVIRLANFSIFLFREVGHPWAVDATNQSQVVRQLIRITDTKGQADPLAPGSGAEFSIVSENIWDLQIAYIAYSDFPSAAPDTPIESNHYYYAKSATGVTNDLLEDIRNKRLKQLNIQVIAIMDDLAGRGNLSVNENVPVLGDRPYTELPPRKLNYKFMAFSVEPRNYNIIL